VEVNVKKHNRGNRIVKRAASCAGLMIAALALLSGTAAAQTESEIPTASARANVGPFEITPMLRVLDLGVDTNVYNSPHAVSDFTFNVSPDIQARAGNTRTGLTLRSVTDFVYFAQQRSERSIDEVLKATGQARVSRLLSSFTAGYVNTRQRPTDEIDARSRRLDYTGAGSVGLALSPKLSANVGGRYAKTVFDADAVFDGSFLGKELNRDAASATGSVQYAATPITTFVVSGDVTRTRFAESPIRDSNSHGMYGGIEIESRAPLSGGVSLGFESFTPLNPVVPAFDGLVGSARVAYRLQRLTSIGFNFDRHIEYSYSEAQPYYVLDGYGLSFRRWVTPRLSLGGNATRSRYVYRRTTADGPFVESIGDRQMRLIDVQVTAGYRTSAHTVTHVMVEYRDRNSDFINHSFRGVRLLTSITYGF